MADLTFLEIIQAHERTWGTETYAGRPSLTDLLNAHIVMVWQPNDGKETRQMFTIHTNLDELNKYATRILIHSRQELPNRRLMAVYVKQKRANIRGVNVEINVVG